MRFKATAQNKKGTVFWERSLECSGDPDAEYTPRVLQDIAESVYDLDHKKVWHLMTVSWQGKTLDYQFKRRKR